MADISNGKSKFKQTILTIQQQLSLLSDIMDHTDSSMPSTTKASIQLEYENKELTKKTTDLQAQCSELKEKIYQMEALVTKTLEAKAKSDKLLEDKSNAMQKMEKEMKIMAIDLANLKLGNEKGNSNKSPFKSIKH